MYSICLQYLLVTCLLLFPKYSLKLFTYNSTSIYMFLQPSVGLPLVIFYFCCSFLTNFFLALDDNYRLGGRLIGSHLVCFGFGDPPSWLLYSKDAMTIHAGMCGAVVCLTASALHFLPLWCQVVI